MGYFFLDDSIHDNGAFIIVAFVYTENDPADAISALIAKNGFDPANFEFKSSAKYVREPQIIGVREDLRSFLSENCEIALAVIPRQQRDNIGLECLKAMKQFLGTNKRLTPPHRIYIDQGMFLSDKKIKNYIADNDIDGCEIFIEQDSQLVRGIQIADLAAHTASIIFKGKLGLIKKAFKRRTLPCNSVQSVVFTRQIKRFDINARILQENRRVYDRDGRGGREDVHLPLDRRLLDVRPASEDRPCISEDRLHRRPDDAAYCIYRRVHRDDPGPPDVLHAPEVRGGRISRPGGRTYPYKGAGAGAVRADDYRARRLRDYCRDRYHADHRAGGRARSDVAFAVPVYNGT